MSRLGGHIPPVQERMEKDLFHPSVFGHAQQSLYMFQVAVDAAVGQEAQQVQGSPRRNAVHSYSQARVGKESPGLNVLADSGQVLIDHPAGADIQVPHFRVAHLTGGQAHLAAAGSQEGSGISAVQLINIRRVSSQDGIACLGPNAPAVHNDQHHLCRRFHCWAPPKLTIPAKLSASRLAPPTKAPSISLCAIKPSIFSGLTLPPYKIRT